MLMVKEAAKKLGLSEALLYGWCACGELTHLRLGGKGRRGSIRIEEADLEAFLQSHKRQGERKETPPVTKPPPLKLRHLQL